ncbi:YggT family protein [Geosporobacter subterraneus DSM 17957]|uniref:YggT family protein n=1 Tax=Geosporobacter subterraneus DSM 17957 TaxID=1121919 RepID=A0A1M6GTD4_9FIRM|nr:YggT family protein [Geosporobacter subterraneus]SHJ13223.1 YggT family protein [Geosporobacter subterraneus DSM 17957]
MWLLRQSVDYFFRVLDFLIIARIIMSWINLNPYGTIYKLIYQLTEPILAPFRNFLIRLGVGGGFIDFSPILAVFTLGILRNIIITLL